MERILFEIEKAALRRNSVWKSVSFLQNHAQQRGYRNVSRKLMTKDWCNHPSSKNKVIGCGSNIQSHRRNLSTMATLPHEELVVNGSGRPVDLSVGSHHDLSPSNIPSLDHLRSLASRKTTALSLVDMFRYASSDESQRLRNAQFLHRELPIRIAQRTVDLLTLPHGLNRTRQVRNIAHKYLVYLRKLEDFPLPTNEAEEVEFTALLQGIVMDRTSIPMAIASAVSSLKDNRREALDDRRLQEMEEALYRFFTARVGLRFLTEHHILSLPSMGGGGGADNAGTTVRSKAEQLGTFFGERTKEDDEFLGCIRKNCDPVFEVSRVAKAVREQCLESFGVAPEIDIVDCTREKDRNRSFTYVPHHLQYMLAELLKNSCRATVKKYLIGQKTNETSVFNVKDGDDKNRSSSNKQDEGLPPIKVVVVKGAEDVAIKIADCGGGVPRSAMGSIWTFAHSYSNQSDEHKESLQFATDNMTGCAIRGFGLPLARIYARYFGGELSVKSMEGYGLDAYLHLPVLGNACEKLPDPVFRSPGNMDSSAASVDVDLSAFSSLLSFSSKEDPHNELNDAFPAAIGNKTLENLSRRAL